VGSSQLLPRAVAEGSLSVGVHGVVHPDERGRGTGTALFGRLLARAPEHVRERGEDLRAVVTATAPSDLPGFAQLATAAGLRPFRYSFAMAADLRAPTGAPPPDLPAGLTLHTWEAADHAELLAAHNRAFVGLPGWTPWDAEMWHTWVSGHRALRPAQSLLARTGDGELAAYVQTDEHDAVRQATGRREAFVAKVGVVPEHRRRGLASTLLRTAMVRYAAAGYDRAALDVDSENPTGALGIYEAAGFTVERRWTTWRLEGRLED
ncbi:MAG: GCN5-related N-acetyltransferase, partial [Marmoricola sp.]|nr:GCN5-related N-acetyltransferase [Marmoricola sp.]